MFANIINDLNSIKSRSVSRGAIAGQPILKHSNKIRLVPVSTGVTSCTVEGLSFNILSSFPTKNGRGTFCLLVDI